MPAPAYTTNPKSDAAVISRSDSSWYSAFTNATDDTEAGPGTSTTPSNDTSFPDPLDTLTASDIPGPHMRRDDDGAMVPALFSLQHTELERLVRDNERLMDRIETLLQIQSREQVLRQQLQNQADRIGEQMKLPVPTATLEAVHREARAGVTEELKPVLMAILDALERFAGKSEGKAAETQIAEPADPFLSEDYGKLPAILTRPLDELIDDDSDPGRSDREAKNRRPRKSPFRRRKLARPAPANARENSDVTTPFTWTTVFSS